MAKRTRRPSRKVETEKQTPVSAPAPTPAPPVEAVPFNARGTLDFGRDYYYVFADLRSLLLIAVVMFALMFGLGFFI